MLRESTTMRARRIGVVEDGRIVELGSHEELIALGGRYAALFETWSRQGGVASSEDCGAG